MRKLLSIRLGALWLWSICSGQTSRRSSKKAFSVLFWAACEASEASEAIGWVNLGLGHQSTALSDFGINTCTESQKSGFLSITYKGYKHEIDQRGFRLSLKAAERTIEIRRCREGDEISEWFIQAAWTLRTSLRLIRFLITKLDSKENINKTRFLLFWLLLSFTYSDSDLVLSRFWSIEEEGFQDQSKESNIWVDVDLKREDWKGSWSM